MRRAALVELFIRVAHRVPIGPCAAYRMLEVKSAARLHNHIGLGSIELKKAPIFCV
jgi:hypothetical protein